MFQHPGDSLNPTRKVRVQFYETILAHRRMEKKEMDELIASVFKRIGLTDVERILNAYPFELSGGMAQRVVIALAVLLHPKLILADEPTSALDTTVQKQVLEELLMLRNTLHTAMIIITHNIGVARHLADRVAVLYKGEIVEMGKTKEVLENPQHPYTKSLMAAVPKLAYAWKGGMMEEILVCENLTMTFDDGEYIVHALKNVSFSLRKNEVLGIIGESGSGKSTIAKLITGLYQPTGGNIFLGGRSIVRLKRQAQKEVYTKVQMVFQDAVGSFNPRRKIGESISDTLCRLCGEKKHTAGKEAARLLEDVGLPGDYAEKYPHELSGGECQRAAIARAMSVHPEILICDEATSALDVSAQAKIVELLMHLRRIHNVSILFITHDLPLVSNISDRILIMNEGELVEEGSTEEVITRPKTVYTRRLLDAVC